MDRVSHRTFPVALVAVMAALQLAAPAVDAAEFYVSRQGGGGDGRSWQTAWRELSQIDWGAIAPGDTIYLDGGPSGVTYESTITPGRNGEPGREIRLLRSTEPGHDGAIVIFGGRSTPLPFSAQPSYTYQTSGVRSNAMYVSSSTHHIVLDGMGWNGITLHGHNGYGIALEQGSSDITLRNLRIYDNGSARWNGSEWHPDHSGIKMCGYNHVIERCVIHDNGQDSIQGWDVGNITIRRCHVYNSRPHGWIEEDVFNCMAHQDGIQITAKTGGGGRMAGFLVEDCVIGPGFNQGMLLGDPTTAECVVDDVTIRNTLFASHWGRSMSTHCMSHDKVSLLPRNWRVENCTFFYNPGTTGLANLYVRGTEGHQVTDNIFTGYVIRYDDGMPYVANNMQHNTRGGVTVGVVEDPQFADTDYAATGDGPDLHAWDFTPLNSNASDKGTSIVTMAVFYGSDELPPVIQRPTVRIVAPDTESVLDAGDAVKVTADAAAADGSTVTVEFFLDGEAVGVDSTVPYETTIAVPAARHILEARATDSSGVSSDSELVIIYGVPLMQGLSWEAEEGLIVDPFEVEEGIVSQSVDVGVPADGGMAICRFVVEEEGDYTVRMLVDAPDEGSNSFFVGMDDAPGSPEAIWDIEPTAGIEDRTVSWRGSGTPLENEFSPVVFTLGPGEHRLIVRGRESGARMDAITVEPVAATEPPPEPGDEVGPGDIARELLGGGCLPGSSTMPPLVLLAMVAMMGWASGRPRRR